MRFRQVTSFDDGGVKSRPLKPPPFHGCEPFFCFTTVGLSPILICFIRVRHGPNSHCFATWGGGEKLFFCFTTEGQTPNLICFSRTGHMAPHACCLSTWGRAPFLLRFTAAGQAPRFHMVHRRVRALFFFRTHFSFYPSGWDTARFFFDSPSGAGPRFYFDKLRWGGACCSCFCLTEAGRSAPVSI